METEMLIGSKFEKGTETEEPILNPKTGETILDLPEASQAQIEAAVAAAEKAFVDLVAHDAGAALRLSPEDRRPHRGRGRGVRRARSAELRQADQRRAERRDPGDRRLLPLLRRRGALDAGPGRRRISARPHLDGPARPDRHRRLDRAVELSADDDGLEAGAGDRRRQHGGLQAVRADAADRAEAGEGAGGDPARGRRQRRARPRRERRQRADQPPQGQHDLDHRRRRHRQEGAAGRRQVGQAHPSGARRQGAGHRLRRRRYRRGGQRPARLRLLQCRPGLHRRLPHLCRQEDLRQARRRPVLGGLDHQIRPAGRHRERDRPADLQAPARPRRLASSSAPRS